MAKSAPCRVVYYNALSQADNESRSRANIFVRGNFSRAKSNPNEGEVGWCFFLKASKPLEKQEKVITTELHGPIGYFAQYLHLETTIRNEVLS